MAAALLCLAAPACSKRSAQGTAKPAAPGAAPRRDVTQPARPAKAAAGPRPAPTRNPAAGPARRHPFVPVLDARAAGQGVETDVGPLVLKGIIDGDSRAAVIQEIRTTHVVREGELIGGLQVLSIREGEVVLGTATRKRILSLYDGHQE